MNRLYWKLFFTFWLTIVLIVVGVAWVNHLLEVRFGGEAVPERLQFVLRGRAEAIAEVIQKRGIRALDHRRDHRHERGIVRAVVVDETGAEVMGRPVPPHLRSELDFGDPPNRTEGKRSYAVTVDDASGQRFRVIAHAELPPGLLYSADRGGVLLRLMIAMAVSALVCGMLARSLTRPISRLRGAAAELASGNLSARVGGLSGMGAREMAQLGNDFDRMAERLERSQAAHKRLLMDVSHELRSPLARIQVATELARKRAGGAADDELDRVVEETGRLNDLIGEVLHLARADQQQTPLRTETVDLNGMLTDIAERNSVPGKSAVHVEANTHCRLEADAVLLDRAIDNVVRNAMRYSPEDKPVTVKALVADNEVTIEILDQGPGIPEADLEQVFRPFYRIGDARDRDSGGYGLGLAIAHSAVQRHGGTIAARNRAAGGLAVVIQLPLR